ncbi:hypothetical protein LPJ70_003959 [Coemansia sp. RSA 2708]|nr:hypothetical protein LPJ70_003959 [Coemansia sp. RSA 2708]
MRLGVPVGYSLGDEQPVLSLVSALEPQPAGPMLSIYSVHTRLVQQLQIAGIPAVESQNIPDPADIYANPSILTPLLEATESLRAVPAQLSEPAQRREPIQRHAAQAPVLPPPAAAATVAAAAAAPTLNGTSELASRVQESVLAQLQPQITAALGELGRGAAARMDAEAEERLAARISAAVEKRVAASVAAAMEETLIPAYTRATAAMFEQMQATFEAGLREWWMRFAQVPPPHAMGTPLSQMVMMPQPSGSAAPERSAMPQQQKQQQHQQPPRSHPMPVPQQFTPASAASGAAHIESLMSMLNFQPNKPQQ